jgi:hypothetical protein
MTSSLASNHDGMTLRQAALVAGFAYLLNPVSYAEASIFPRLVIPGNIEQTVLNISAHGHLFLVAILCYFISFLGDIVLAWSLYVLLAPVNRSLSLLASIFQLVYAAIAFDGVVNLVTAYNLLTAPEYLAAFGTAPLHAQVMLQLHAFRHHWALSLVLFGIHLVLIGYLIFHSSYIPKIIGILLMINGLGWVLDSMGPYFFPHANFGFLFITFFAEIVFMFWLLIRGWKIKQPAPQS